MTTEQDKLIWKRDYIDPMFEKYKDIPTKLKYMFIEKDYINMYGKQMANDQMRYMYNDTENFIFAFENSLYSFNKTIKKNILKKYLEDLALNEYGKLHDSKSLTVKGFPKLIGSWKIDKDYFSNFVFSKEKNKQYVKQILE